MTKKKVTKAKKEVLTSIPTEEENEQLIENDTQPEEDLSTVTVQELEKMISEYAEQKEEVDQAELVVANLKKIRTNTERRLLAFMNEFDKSSYRSTWGTLIKSGRYSWKTPKTPETRNQFFGYLREKGVFDGLISVNANTLSSFAKAEMAAAVERQDIDFAIPGLEEPSYTERVSLRRK